MKTVKTTKKNTKKTIKNKPLFFVNLTDVKFMEEVPQKFVSAKVRYNVPITLNELLDVSIYGANFACWYIFNEAWDYVRADKFSIDIKTFDAIIKAMTAKATKLPWYKRAWNWITRKNK